MTLALADEPSLGGLLVLNWGGGYKQGAVKGHYMKKACIQ